MCVRIQAHYFIKYFIGMNGNYIWGIIVLIIIIVGGWFLLKGTPTSAPTTTDQTSAVQTPAVTNTTTTTSTTTTSSGVTVFYTASGFSPKSVTVPLGTTVTFVNQSPGSMWVASAAHPAHTAYSGTNLSQHCPDTTNSAFDECAAVTSGNSYSFTFNKVGDWKYHNHVNASDFGAVIVTPAATTITASTTVQIN
ncbi:MAG: hypothetical protein Q8P23_03520 [bacterium]|nr:hypothetical protein [bacterium]